MTTTKIKFKKGHADQLIVGDKFSYQNCSLVYLVNKIENGIVFFSCNGKEFNFNADKGVVKIQQQ